MNYNDHLTVGSKYKFSYILNQSFHILPLTRVLDKLIETYSSYADWIDLDSSYLSENIDIVFRVKSNSEGTVKSWNDSIIWAFNQLNYSVGFSSADLYTEPVSSSFFSDIFSSADSTMTKYIIYIIIILLIIAFIVFKVM